MKVGILGGGQLARMIALAGYPLGVEFVVLDPSADACSTSMCEHLQGEYDDEALLAQLAARADVVTYEFENVPAQVADFLAAHTTVHPAPKALAVAQDRLVEKNFLRDLGIPTPAYAPVNTLAELEQVMPEIGWPAILKSRTQGYDGKGQSVLRSPADLAQAWEVLQGVPAIVEGFVPFSREISIIAVRNASGAMVFYPVAENLHRGGILRISECLAADPMQALAEDYASRLVAALDYVGVLALELFEVDGQLVANEFAPRVHNSGHWTIEGAETSQFENHVRAILDLPLGSTKPVGHAAMVNFIGGIPPLERLLRVKDAHVHLYAKAPRKGRKVAHVTARAANAVDLTAAVSELARLAEQVDDS